MSIIEVESLDELLEILTNIANEEQVNETKDHPNQTYMDFGNDTEDYDISRHNCMLIDQIINNTLRQSNPITQSQVQVMTGLKKLQATYLGGE